MRKDPNDEVSDTTAAEQRSLVDKQKLIQDSLVSHVQFEPVCLHRFFIKTKLN